MARHGQRRIFVPTRSAEDWRPLLAKPDEHWKEGYSAHCLATCWQGAIGVPPEISSLVLSHPEFSGAAPELIIGLPELQTSLPGGTTASQTDLFAIVACGDELIALGIEGKVAESFDETLGKWLADASSGKKERLEYLCGLLELRPPLPEAIRYQLLHRAAAAVIEARRFKIKNVALVIHSFSPEHLWFSDFVGWCKLFGQVPERGKLVFLTTLSGTRLYAGWATGNVSRAGIAG